MSEAPVTSLILMLLSFESCKTVSQFFNTICNYNRVSIFDINIILFIKFITVMNNIIRVYITTFAIPFMSQIYTRLHVYYTI